ncbi:MAG: hypothetical protein H6925_04635 [Holosporaceae bacterium]|nr:MAG: hypothetical protein H6925_04635 [Holosporaceae bacterium]
MTRGCIGVGCFYSSALYPILHGQDRWTPLRETYPNNVAAQSASLPDWVNN